MEVQGMRSAMGKKMRVDEKVRLLFPGSIPLTGLNFFAGY
jgi:hypothetical protein